MTAIPIAAAGLAVALFAYSILSLFAPEERRVRRRLTDLNDYETRQAMEAEPLLQPFRVRVISPGAQAMARAARRASPVGYVNSLRDHIARAGNPGGLGIEGLLAIKVAALLTLGVGVFLLTILVGGTLGGAVFSALILGTLGFFAPDLWVSSAESSRKTAIRRALPDMLDMLTISVEAGLGFDAAVAKLVGNSKGPLAEEFARMLQEVQAGIPRQEALKHLSHRTDVPEVATFVTSMVQAEVFGISVSKVLRTQAREMRVKRRQYAEEAAQKAPVKIIFPLILCILPATMIVILGPAVISIGRVFGIVP